MHKTLLTYLSHAPVRAIEITFFHRSRGLTIAAISLSFEDVSLFKCTKIKFKKFKKLPIIETGTFQFLSSVTF